MRIDNKVFERHNFRLERCYVDTGDTYELRMVWRKDYFSFEFVTNKENGYFDDADYNNYVRPSEEPYTLLHILDTSEELLAMARETNEIDKETAL